MERSRKRGGSVAVLGIAAALIALCTIGLASFLSRAEAAEDAVLGTAPLGEASISDEVFAPEGLEVKVDTRGIELPEGAVSANYAVAAATEIAERAYGQIATGRAQAVLYNSETTMAPNYDVIHGLYWKTTVETEGGLVDADVVAQTGADCGSSFSAYSSGGWAKAFDAWDADAENSGRFGTEEELAASRDQNPAPAPLMNEEQQAEAHAMKRASMMEFAESVVGEPHAARAVEIIGERGIGNGASPTSGRILMRGGSGPLDEEIRSIYVVEVALDDGTYVFANIGVEDLELYGWERSPIDMPTRMYG